ncbi:hypothetical protein HZA96_04920 [Candidatus Woesearchaeota archaeon]|nr:hypothetical protein [Candidatus Woesearchaeota archaeon]
MHNKRRVKLTPQSSSDQTTKVSRFRKWGKYSLIVAPFLILGAVKFGLSPSSSIQNPVSVTSVKTATELNSERQEKLNAMQRMLNAPCVRKIIYFSSVDFEQELRSELASTSATYSFWIQNISKMVAENEPALVVTDFNFVGTKSQSNIYILPSAFDHSNDTLRAILEHETVHTIQNQKGLQCGNILINWSNYKKYSKALVTSILETIAYAHEIRYSLENNLDSSVIKSAIRSYGVYHTNILKMQESGILNAHDQELAKQYILGVFLPIKPDIEKYVQEYESYL